MGETEQKAYIHWGHMKDGAWEEFNKTAVDESTGTASLRGLYEGYTYVQAYYSTVELADPTTADTHIEAYITQAGDGSWQYYVGEILHPIANGSHIYAVYVENGSEGAPPIIPAPDNKDPLNTQKSVVANKNADGTPDGTYKITLSVTGDQVVTEEPKNANVVLVLDQSISMRERVSSSGPYRYAAVSDAAQDLIEAMPIGGRIDMCIVTFGTGSQTPRNWMTINSASDKTTLKNDVATAMAYSNVNKYGTNWDSGLNRAKSEADKKVSEKETTFIIFLTDGCPSVNDSNNDSHGSAGTTNANDRCISNALTRMNAIVGAGYTVYGIYANTTGNNTRVTTGGVTYTDPLAYVLSASNAASVGGGYVKASDADALNDAFKKIAANILTYLGYNNVQVNDGVTDLTNVSAAVSTAGPAGNFVYTRDGGTNLDGTKKYDNEVWTEAPTASASDTGVTWDLAAAGNLEAGVTYSVSFDIWPSQEAYDLIADLNNGEKNYDTLPESVKAQIGGTGPNGYYLLTNTFLNTTYTFEGDPTKTYSVVGDKGTNAMPLDTEIISLLKFWPANNLDEYGEGHSQSGVQEQIKLTVTKDGADYIKKTLTKSDDDPDTGWVPATGQEKVYISCGVMTVKDGVVHIMEGSEGHDYTIKEPGIFSYYWDLIADVYHPMVINGKTTMLVLDKTKTAQDLANGVYQIGTDDKGKPKYYRTEPGETTIGDDGSTITTFYMNAYNYRRSNLNLTKEIVDACDVADTAYFTYEVKVTDAAGEDVWFSAFDPTAGEEGEIVKDTDWVISGATAQAGNTGYWYATSGATVKFKIKAGWNVRFLNLLHGSTFSFTETDMDEAFELNSITGTKKFDFEDTTLAPDAWITSNSTQNKKIEGEILEPNNSYTVTFKNNYTTYFYIYHSSNNKVERISNKDSRVTKGSKGEMLFDITKEVNTGYLYGGYFQTYAGQKMTDAQIIASKDYPNNSASRGGVYSAATTTTGWITDTGASPYTGSSTIAWKKAYTVKGTAAEVQANKVYHLKEVPEQYFRPALYYIYDDIAPGKPLVHLYLMVPADDSNYKLVCGKPIVISEQKKLYSSFTVGTTAYTAQTVNASLPKGYLTVWKADDKISANETYTWKPYFLTKDGVTVTSITSRTISMGNACADGINVTDQRTGSTVE